MSDGALPSTLVALELLKVRIEAEIQRQKGALDLKPGETVKVEILGSKPDELIEVGSVVRPKDTVTARVSDPVAWKAWVEKNRPQMIRLVPAQKRGVVLTDALRTAIMGALARVDLIKEADPWADQPGTFLAYLEAFSGWTLAPIEAEPERSEVSFEFEQGVLERSKKAKQPVDSDGVVPDGISVDEVPNAVRVNKTKDAPTAERFIESLGGIRAIAGGQ